MKLAKSHKVVLDALHEDVVLSARDLVANPEERLGLALVVMGAVRAPLRVVAEEVNHEGLVHEEARVVVIDADLDAFEEALRAMLERHARVHLGQHLLIFLIDDDHGQFLILNEITAFVVEDFQSDATIATFFGFFFKCKLYIDAFADHMCDGSRRTELSIFENASGEIEEAIEQLLVVQSLPFS